MATHVIATAGHVDHGKSTLIRAMTGTDPDRLAEEKARGLTIDLGFAWMQLPSGTRLGFVDVPGHTRFVKNMLAGVGAVETCLFVVAATEGWKPQSEEHLCIVDLLGLSGGVVALSKAALVDDARLTEVTAQVTARLRGTVLESARIVPTDAPSGLGVEELIVELDRLVHAVADPADRDRPRLWVDRCFSVRGSGTVVTGTLSGGEFRLHDELQIVPVSGAAPVGVRVRSIESHGEALAALGPGHRVALGLVGTGGGRLKREDAARGSALVRTAQWSPTKMVDVELSLLDTAPAAIGRRGAFHAHFGSGEHSVRLRVLGSDVIGPGDRGLARLHLPVPLPLLPGDRFILRDVGRSTTVGGGQVLDVAPVRPASRARPDMRVERVVAERGWVDVDELERLTGERRQATIGRFVVDRALFEESRRRLSATVEGAGPAGLDTAALSGRDRLLLGTLVAEGTLRVSSGRAHAGQDTIELVSHPFLRALEAAPFSPPSAASFGVDRAELRALIDAGLVVERDGHHFAASALEQGCRAVAELLGESPDGVTVSAVRERLCTSRRHVLPFLALLDARGITRRRGDLRIAGPRLLADELVQEAQ